VKIITTIINNNRMILAFHIPPLRTRIRLPNIIKKINDGYISVVFPMFFNFFSILDKGETWPSPSS